MNKVNQPVIETERLLLKELNREIVKEAMTSCSDEELMELFGVTTAEALATEKSNHMLGMSTYRMTYKKYVMIEKTTGKCIGKCGFHNWYAMHRRSEIGYMIEDETAKRKGYMTEAVRALLQYGFEQMNLNRIEAYVGSNNVPSLKIVTSHGFVQEGILREHYCKDGVIEDSVCFGLLLSDYERVKGTWEQSK